jgi:hypothetical protein
MEKEEGVSRMPLDEVRGTAATVDSQEGSSRGPTGGEVTNGRRSDQREENDQQDKDPALTRSTEEEEEKQFNSSFPRARIRRHVGSPKISWSKTWLGRLGPHLCSEQSDGPDAIYGFW